MRIAERLQLEAIQREDRPFRGDDKESFERSASRCRTKTLGGGQQHRGVGVDRHVRVEVATIPSGDRRVERGVHLVYTDDACNIARWTARREVEDNHTQIRAA